MKELDYINATNLAKLRIAAECLRSVMVTKQEESAYSAVMESLYWLIANYEKRV